MPRLLSLPPIRSAAAALAVAVVGVSVLAAIVSPVKELFALSPAAVLSGFIWQPLTFSVLEGSPMGVIFSALIIISIGGGLEASWGRSRLLRFALGVTTLAGCATVLLSLVWTGLQHKAGYFGGGALAGSLWLAYGLATGHRTVSFWGLPVTGNQFALIGAGFVFLNAAFIGIGAVVPDAFALLFAFLAVRNITPARLFERLRSWQLERSYKRRSSKLSVIAGEKRNMPDDSDRYLH